MSQYAYARIPTVMKTLGYRSKQGGFTIVELLIVIVVIGILAAITIVAYTGIQNRANDTAVQADLRNFAGKIMQHQAVEGVYPTGGITSSPTGENFRIARSSYHTGVHNFIYCTSRDSGVTDFVIAARSKSGQRFSYSSSTGNVAPYNQTWGGVVDVCTNAGWTSYSVSYGYRSDGTWWPWVQ